MDLSSIAQLTTSISSVGSQAGSSVGSRTTQVARQDEVTPAAKALKRATSRTEESLQSAKVQLSAYGQIKGAVSELQTASRAVSDPKKTATADDARKAIENFVGAFNKAHAAVNNATKNNGKEAGALANDSRARIAGNDLRRSVSEGNSSAELKKAGITQNKDGSLSLDSKALDKALKESPEQTVAAVGEVGKQVEKTATRALANNGNVGGSVENLNKRSRSLEAEQSAQKALVEASQRSVEQQSVNISKLATGIAAYQRNFLG